MMNNVALPAKESVVTTDQVLMTLDSRLRRFQENLTLLAPGVNKISGTYYEPSQGNQIEVVSLYGGGFLGDVMSGLEALQGQLDFLNTIITELNKSTKTGLYTAEADALCEAPVKSFRS